MELQGINNINAGAGNDTFGKSVLDQEDFMQLLLEELAHQDPMNPMDSKEFTVQLTQFSSLEGIKEINNNLNDLLSHQQSMQNAAVANMIGKSVIVDGNSVNLNGSATMSYDLGNDAALVKVIIRDAGGRIVRSGDTGPQSAGNKNYLWDGKDDLGNPLADGPYTFGIEAVDSRGNPVAASSLSSGYVTGVTFDSGAAYLVLDGRRNVNMADIKSIVE